MKKSNEAKKPFFAKLLEAQKLDDSKDVKGGGKFSRKYPSDVDEAVTMKYPSDGDDHQGS